LQSNILIDDSHEALLNDFGLAKVLEDINNNGGYRTNLTVSDGAQSSLRWMAPELMQEDHVSYGTAADVYAWAMTALHVRLYTVASFGFVNLTDVHRSCPVYNLFIK
jgi:serine/threonine protein kinase